MRDPSGLRQRDESWHVGGQCIVVLVMCFFASLLALFEEKPKPAEAPAVTETAVAPAATETVFDVLWRAQNQQ